MITARLQCIIDHVNGKVVADIGTDHAYVPVRLIEDGRAKTVIASDIRTGPVETAKRTVEKYGMSDKIEVRKGAGLSVLGDGEADTIIIAGMGGILISEILENDKAVAEKADLVLQPMNSQYELRKYLHENGYSIISEDLSLEGFKVYNLMCAKKGREEPYKKDIFYHLPESLFEHKYFKDLYNKKKREFTKVVKGLENSKDTDEEKLEKYRFWLSELEALRADVRINSDK